MSKSPILLGFNLINSSIILSSDRPCEPFNDFIKNVLILLDDIKGQTDFADLMYTSTSVSEMQEEIVFVNVKYAQIVYSYILKHLDLDKLPPGITFKESIPADMKENFTHTVHSIQQLIANSAELAFRMDSYCTMEPTEEMVRMQEEIQVLADLIKSQSLIIFKKLEAFCE